MQYFSEFMAKVEAERDTRSPIILPTLELLKELQYKYVHAVVYSNLGIIVGRHQSLSAKDAYNSIVINNEGGTCLTINLAFYHMLKKVGFKAHLVSPLVLNYNERSQNNDRSTHMAIRVKIRKKLYLVDPGWGNSSRTPVCFTGELANHPMGTFRLTEQKGLMCLEKKFATWIPQFTFSKFERMKDTDFDDLLKFICEDNSVFRQMLFVTKADESCCKSLIDDQIYTIFSDGRKTENSVYNHGGISAVLTEIFGLSDRYISEIEWVKGRVVEKTYFKLSSMWNSPKNLNEKTRSSREFVSNGESVQGISNGGQNDLQILQWNQELSLKCDEVCLDLKEEGKAIMQEARLFYEVFEKNASDPAFQDRKAVIDEKNNKIETLSYKELNENANRMAHNLIKLKRLNEWTDGACIGLFLENSAEAVVSILAIMKAGLAFVPLPTNNESNYNRIKKYYIQGSDLKGIILTNEKRNDPILLSVKNEIDRLKICYFEEMCKCVCSNHCECADNPNIKLVKDQLSYIIFSSGSTGPAKGIKIAHRGLYNAAEGIVNAYQSGDNKLGSDEKFGCNASLLFDASIVDILAPLSVGATLVIVPGQYHTDGVKLNEFLKSHQVTRISLVPATLKLLDFSKLTQLRGIISTGEKANKVLFDSIPGSVDLFNGYGPAEATIVTSLSKFNRGGEPNLIGEPIEGLGWFILEFDPNDIDCYPRAPNLARPRKEGELYLAGENVGLGYVTIGEEQPSYHKRFREICHPIDNTRTIRIFQTGDIVKLTDMGLEYVRRVDEQIKYFGELIHPGAIENAMDQFTINEEKVFEKIKVVAVNSRYRGFPLLIAYVKLQDGKCITDANIRALYHFLNEHEYSTRIPSRFCIIENGWPLLERSKKTDVAQLSSCISRVQFCIPPFDLQPEEPEQQVTKIIRKIWREVLDIEEKDLPILSMDCSFYELGGDSVRVLQMLHNVREVFRDYIPNIMQFDSFPTLRALVFRVLNGNNPDLHDINWYPRKPNNKKSFNRLIESGFYPILLVNSVSGESKIDFRNIINPISENFPQHPLLQASALSLHNSGYRVRSYSELARDYIASINKDEFMSSYAGPVILIGYSTGGVLAYEIARQFQIQRRCVIFFSIDSMSPNYYRNLDQFSHASMLTSMINQMLVKCFIPIKFTDKVSEVNQLPIELTKKIREYQVDKQIELIIRFLTERLETEEDEKAKKQCLSYFSTIHNMIQTVRAYDPQPLCSEMTLVSFSRSVDECKRICPNAEDSRTSRLLWDGAIALSSVDGEHSDFIAQDKECWVSDVIMPTLKTKIDRLKEEYHRHKRTFEYEINKIEPIMSRFRHIVIIELQIAVRKAENVRVIGFLADVQFKLLKDIRHKIDASKFLNRVVSSLVNGLTMLNNEIESNFHSEIIDWDSIRQLFKQLCDVENRQPIWELFDHAKERITNEVLKKKLESVSRSWKELIVNVDFFSPRDIYILSTAINNASEKALFEAQKDITPDLLNIDRYKKPGEYLLVLYKVVCTIGQLYKKNVFFEIKSMPEQNCLRDDEFAYIERLRLFMVKLSYILRNDKEKIDFSSLNGVESDYTELLEDVYERMWELMNKKSVKRVPNEQILRGNQQQKQPQKPSAHRFLSGSRKLDSLAKDQSPQTKSISAARQSVRTGDIERDDEIEDDISIDVDYEKYGMW